jgi:hypothetical protein
MSPKYVTQVLIKQVKIDPYSAKYIVDLLIQEETNYWKAIFNKVLYDLINCPQVKSIYTNSQLLYIAFCKCFNIIKTEELNNIQTYYNTSEFKIDTTYYKFMTKINIHNML